MNDTNPHVTKTHESHEVLPHGSVHDHTCMSSYPLHGQRNYAIKVWPSRHHSHKRSDRSERTRTPPPIVPRATQLATAPEERARLPRSLDASGHASCGTSVREPWMGSKTRHSRVATHVDLPPASTASRGCRTRCAACQSTPAEAPATVGPSPA